MSKYADQVMEMRLEWRSTIPNRCMYCGRGDDWPGLQIHEIERRSAASNRWGHTANFLVLCGECHAGPFASMVHCRQLAVKLLKDPEHFDLVAWLRIKDTELRAPTRVTMENIVQFLEMKDV